MTSKNEEGSKKREKGAREAGREGEREAGKNQERRRLKGFFLKQALKSFQRPSGFHSTWS